MSSGFQTLFEAGQNSTTSLGQNVLVVPRVPGHFFRCPCGIDAYDNDIIHSPICHPDSVIYYEARFNWCRRVLRIVTRGRRRLVCCVVMTLSAPSERVRQTAADDVRRLRAVT